MQPKLKLKRIRKIFRRKKTERWKQALLDRMRNLKKKSRKWDNHDQRDIVEAIYLINDKMLELHDSLRKMEDRMDNMSAAIRKIVHHVRRRKSPYT